MIVPIKGNVEYPITLDPSVWIFDDRKILFEKAFNKDHDQNESVKESEQDKLNKTYEQKINPPVNKSITRFEREKILKNTYVMPINEFLAYAEVKSGASEARIVSKYGDEVIPLHKLEDCYLLFSVKGKPLTEDGPVHVYYKDGSNKDEPIKGVEAIVIQ